MDNESVNKQAESDLGDIFALRRSQAFNRYFMREPAVRVAALEKALTDAEKPLTGKSRNIALGELKAWRLIATKLQRDLDGNALILGVDPTEKVVPD